jgi:Skp family chaperone for outer membrane proteins
VNHHRRTRLPSRALPSLIVLVSLLAAPTLTWGDERQVVRPMAVTEAGAQSSDDPELQARLDALREQYNQDRQALKAKSSQLSPEERLRLHRELLEAHRAALAKLDQESRSRSQGSRERWEKRREQRVERLEEARKDGSSRKRPALYDRN